jgi:ATPase subunit of ABC transporter with duplicated ATPase domains
MYACTTVDLQGNYNTFETVRGEQLKNQKRAYEADKAKREHMQVNTACTAFNIIVQ